MNKLIKLTTAQDICVKYWRKHGNFNIVLYEKYLKIINEAPQKFD